MNQQLEQFDGKKLQERVVETVRAQYAAMIPEDVWNNMIEREIAAFYEETQEFVWDKRDNTPSYGRNQEVVSLKITPFRQMIWDELRKINQKNINNFLYSPEFTAIMTLGAGEKAELSENLEKILMRVAPAMAASLFSNMFVDAVNQARCALLTEMQNRY